MAKTLKIKAPVSGLFESIRGFKYSFHEAVADLVDNSVDASAVKIDIFAEKNKHILIVDDGKGMDKEALEDGVTPWKNAGKKSKSSVHQKGKYGIGLKSAGFSLGDIIQVHTRKRGGDFFTVTLDLEQLRNARTEEIPFSNEETEIWKKYGHTTGTIIEIRKPNNRKITDDAIQGLTNRLGLSFYGLLESHELLININNTPVEGLNPLLIGLKRNSRNNGYVSFPSKTIKVPNENGEKVEFKLSSAYIGRSIFWNDKEKKRYRWFLNKKKKDSVKIEDQGLYILRNGRLITHGGWHGTRPLNHHGAPFRVLIEYSTEGDSLIGVDHTKTKPDMDKDFINIINSQYINKYHSQIVTLFKDEEKERVKLTQSGGTADSELKSKPLPKPSSVDSMMSKEEKLLAYSPKYKEQQDELDEDLEEELEDEWIKFAERLPYDCMWQPKLNKEGDVTCFFSDTHPGYAALYYEDDPDQLRRNLNTFFLLLSNYELDFAELSNKLTPTLKEELKKQLEAYRRYVSKHFREFD